MAQKADTNDKASPDSPKPKRRRKWFRGLLRWGIRLIVLAVVLVVLARHVGAPLYWRWATKAFLADYWTGPVRIGSVDFHLADGTAILSNVSLRDHAEREWVHINTLTYYLRDWPSLRPILYEIRVDEPAVTVYLDDGQVNMPVKGSTLDDILEDESVGLPDPSAPEGESSAPPNEPGRWDLEYYIHIEKTFLNDISLVVVESDPHFLRGKIQPTESRLLRNLRFYGTASAGGDISFTYGDRLDTRARAEFRLNLSKLVVRDLRSLLRQPPLRNGPQVKPLIVKDVNVPQVTYHNGNLEIPRFSMNVGKGFLRGNLNMRITADAPITFTGDVRAHRIPLRSFFDAYDPTREVMYGYASVLIDDIAGSTRDLRDLEMDGAVAMDDSDLDRVHVVGDVFSAMHVNEKHIRNGTDLRVIFELRDGVMSLAKARLGNNIVAVMAEPYGTVDIVDRKMNLRVIGGMLHDLGKIPLIGWVANMANQLTALRVTGDWSRPVIRVEPIRNVTSSMASFFKDVTRTGGELTGLREEE
ncbi:MAG: hypothetical protein JXA11_13980 [Phycisphaerae bacterium]|nr:hypothetical protein [Phycisphaerae bacterium]